MCLILSRVEQYISWKQLSNQIAVITILTNQNAVLMIRTNKNSVRDSLDQYWPMRGEYLPGHTVHKSTDPHQWHCPPGDSHMWGYWSAWCLPCCGVTPEQTGQTGDCQQWLACYWGQCTAPWCQLAAVSWPMRRQYLTVLTNHKTVFTWCHTLCHCGQSQWGQLTTSAQ